MEKLCLRVCYALAHKDVESNGNEDGTVSI